MRLKTRPRTPVPHHRARAMLRWLYVGVALAPISIGLVIADAANLWPFVGDLADVAVITGTAWFAGAVGFLYGITEPEPMLPPGAVRCPHCNGVAPNRIAYSLHMSLSHPTRAPEGPTS